jgi:hypothetical protein
MWKQVQTQIRRYDRAIRHLRSCSFNPNALDTNLGDATLAYVINSIPLVSRLATRMIGSWVYRSQQRHIFRIEAVHISSSPNCLTSQLPHLLTRNTVTTLSDNPTYEGLGGVETRLLIVVVDHTRSCLTNSAQARIQHRYNAAFPQSSFPCSFALPSSTSPLLWNTWPAVSLA